MATKISQRQGKLINYARQNGGHITKKQAVELIGNSYYHNGAKYVGEILTRMVKQGVLKRLKPGHFEIGRIGIINSKNAEIQPENQTDLFK